MERGDSLAASLPPGISQLLADWGVIDQHALQGVVPCLYEDLRRIAHQHMRRARPGHTLQTTALVHEVYLRLEQYQNAHFQSRTHFLAICALLMRQVLVEYARNRHAAKRGAGQQNLSLEDVGDVTQNRPIDLLKLDDALDALARLDPKQSQIVELRFFGGLSIEEIADVVKISPATVKRHWATARLWLYEQMRGETNP